MAAGCRIRASPASAALRSVYTPIPVTLGVIDGSDTSVATLTTDANGNYLFTGLSDGHYIASIECVSGSPQTPLTGYTFTGTDSDTGRCGQQQAVFINGGVSVLSANFGYRATTPRSVSGTLWQDSNDNGAIDSGEGKLAGVTIDLIQNSTVVATTATASDGTYSFNGLASGTYTIKITDTAGVLTGYSTSYERPRAQQVLSTARRR